MSRALINDFRVAKSIADSFVPVSGAIERLQPSRYGNPETESSRWFQPMAKAALKKFAPPKWWEQFQSYQGLYVVGADGTCYDYQIVWELPPEKYVGILEQALVRFAENPPEPVRIAAATTKAATPEAPDPSTSTLRVLNRIRPLPKDCGSANEGIGRDHMWIFNDEVQALLQAADEAGGTSFPLPRRITGRLVRFQLLDTVRNVSPAFSETDVSLADFSVHEVSGEAGAGGAGVAGPTRRFRFHGVYNSHSESGERGRPFGMRGWLQGEFDVDPHAAKIKRFRAYGEATASGQNNAGAPEDDYPVVFAIIDVDDDISNAVPPLYHDISPVWRPIYRDPKLPAD